MEKTGDPAWRNPTVLIAAGGLLLSLFGNIVQYRSAQTSAATSHDQLLLAQSKSAAELEKLRAEIVILQNTAHRAREECAAIQTDLEEVNRNISIWDNALTTDNGNLLLMKTELSRFESESRPVRAAAARKNIRAQQDMIKQKSDEKSAELAQRAELERRLAVCR
jgi:chromosome segregation ATPase